MKNYLWLAVMAALIVSGCQPTAQSTASQSTGSGEITEERVEEAYTWGLGIVALYRYYSLMGPSVGGLNQMAHNRTLILPGQFSGGPNRDGTYSFGWFDLNDEPIVVSLPDFGERYFVWQMTDMYARNFHNVGSHLRDVSTERYRSGYTFAMVGPD